MSNNINNDLDAGFSLNGKVYFIFQKDDETRCKIGKSIHPDKRKRQLQTGNPDELYVYKTIQGYTWLEGVLQSKYKNKQIRDSEWYNLTKEDVDVIVDEYNKTNTISIKKAHDVDKVCRMKV